MSNLQVPTTSSNTSNSTGTATPSSSATASSSTSSSSNNNNSSSSGSSTRRVFKKQSYDEQLTLYVPTREYIDTGANIDTVDAVLLIDDAVRKNRDKKVFLKLLCTFRYGSNDWDVLGVGFERQLYESTVRVFPPPEKYEKITKFQERMCRKLGRNSFPATLMFSPHLPSSVQLLTLGAEKIKGKDDSCGVFYDIIAYVAKDESEPPNKKHSARFAIKKVTHFPQSETTVPKAVAEKKDPLIEFTLSKGQYNPTEAIEINASISNNSSRDIKSIELRLIQLVTLQMSDAPKSWKYKNEITFLESTADCPIGKGKTYQRTFTLFPIIPDRNDKKEVRHVAIDSSETGEDPKLASTTRMSHSNADNNLGLVVNYYVYVKLHRSMGDIKLKIPFVVSHVDRVRSKSSAPSSASANKIPSLLQQAAQNTMQDKDTGKKHTKIPEVVTPENEGENSNGDKKFPSGGGTEYVSGTEFDDMGDWDDGDTKLSEEFSKFISERAKNYD